MISKGFFCFVDGRGPWWCRWMANLGATTSLASLMAAAGTPRWTTPCCWWATAMISWPLSEKSTFPLLFVRSRRTIGWFATLGASGGVRRASSVCSDTRPMRARRATAAPTTIRVKAQKKNEWNEWNEWRSLWKSGVGCKGGPKTLPVCGMCGILSDSVYPEGVMAFWRISKITLEMKNAINWIYLHRMH